MTIRSTRSAPTSPAALPAGTSPRSAAKPGCQVSAAVRRQCVPRPRWHFRRPSRGSADEGPSAAVVFPRGWTSSAKRDETSCGANGSAFRASQPPAHRAVGRTGSRWPSASGWSRQRGGAWSSTPETAPVVLRTKRFSATKALCERTARTGAQAKSSETRMTVRRQRATAETSFECSMSAQDRTLRTFPVCDFGSVDVFADYSPSAAPSNGSTEAITPRRLRTFASMPTRGVLLWTADSTAIPLHFRRRTRTLATPQYHWSG